MNLSRPLFYSAFILTICCGKSAHAGADYGASRQGVADELDAPSFELASESAYMLGVFGNPHNYEIAGQFITARLRLGAVHSDSWMRGYNQVYFQIMGEPFIRGLENHYFGINAGFRYNFVQPGRRWSPYVSGGVGLGDIDATKEVTPGAIGQNFTFNVQSALGVSYKMDQHWRFTAGIIYQHLSNAGLSEPERPNSSLNTLGPQLGATYSF